MSVSCGFFNSVDGDRVYNADDLSNFFSGVLDDGVIKGYDGGLVVSASSGTTVSVAGGKAVCLGKYIKNIGTYELTLSAGGTQPRYDAIVVGTDLSERTATIYVKKGTESSSPAYPTILDTDTVKELCLAYIYVGAGATSIVAANITDKRADESVCGYCHFTNVSDQLATYRNTAALSFGDDTATIGIDEYGANSTLLVYLNGYLLTAGTDYTVSGSGSTATVTLAHAMLTNNDNVLEFVVQNIELG